MPIVLFAVLVVAGLAVTATWPGFVTKRIVVSGNERVSRGEILTRARVAAHVSIWLQNTGAIAKRIEAIPFVDVARVRRIPPATIRIVITERRPFAVLRSGDEAALVDRALRVLEPAAGAASYPELIVEPGVTFEPGEFVRRPNALALRDAYEQIDAGKIVPVSLQYDKFGGLVVTIRGGLRLLLGAQSDLSQKLTLADAILSQVVSRQRRVAAIDLRAPSAPVLVYR
jgi:cell division septal protein FtsQ